MIYVYHGHRSYLHGVLQYEVMRGSLIFKVGRFARGVSVVVAVLLICFGVCLTLLSLDQGANGNASPLDGTYYPLALAEEAEEDPVNAGLLMMFFLAASFFGASVGWLLTNAQGQGALCCSSVGVVGEVLGSAREDYLPFLGVFRL